MHRLYGKLKMNIKEILNKDNLNKDEIEFLLALADKEDIQRLYERAYDVKCKQVSNNMYHPSRNMNGAILRATTRR